VCLVFLLPRHATLVPDAVIIYIAGTTTKLSPSSTSPIPSSTPASGPAPAPTIALDPAPSISSHSAETISAETLSIPITRTSSALAYASVPSPRSPPDIALVPATPALHSDAESIPDEPDAERSAAKPASTLMEWWGNNRKGVVSGVKKVLEVASKVVEDIPAGGSTAAMVLDYAANALEHVQVMLPLRERLPPADSFGRRNHGRMWKPSVTWSRM
jgi:hypothetical protein